MEKKVVNVEKLEMTNFIPSWISDGDLLNMDEDTKKIIYFFVAETPCKDESARGKTLSQYGWDKSAPPKNGEFEKKLFEIAELTEENLFFESKREEMKELFNKTGMTSTFYKKLDGNFIVSLRNGNSVLEIFRHIRNSLAHLRFEIKNTGTETFFIFEDGTKFRRQFEVKARMILKKETLLKWIEWIKTGAEKIKEQVLEKEAEIENEILEFIKNNNVQSVEKIAQELEYEKRQVGNAIKRMKEQNKIEYKNKKWKAIELKKAS